MTSQAIWIPGKAGNMNAPGTLLVKKERLTFSDVPQPLRLIFNIDSSGSMTTYLSDVLVTRQKVVIDLIVQVLTDRKAMKQPLDRLIIVEYNTEAYTLADDILLSDFDIDTFAQSHQVPRGGGTNISAGNVMVFDILARTDRKMNHMEFSFTDGHANHGLTKPAELAQAKSEQYQLLKSTFGTHPMLFTYAVSSGADATIPQLMANTVGLDNASYVHIRDDDFGEFAAEFGAVLGLSTSLTKVEMLFKNPTLKVTKNVTYGNWSAWPMDSVPFNIGMDISVCTNPAALPLTELVHKNFCESEDVEADLKHVKELNITAMIMAAGTSFTITLSYFQQLRSSIVAKLEAKLTPELGSISDLGLLRQMSHNDISASATSNVYRKRYSKLYKNQDDNEQLPTVPLTRSVSIFSDRKRKLLY